MTTNTPSKQNSRRYSFRVGVGLMCAALLVTVLLPCLSAFQIISVLQELTAYFWCFLGFMFGAYVFNRRGTELLSLRERIGALLLSMCGLLAFIYAWGHSSSMFAFWMTKGVPQVSWSQMSSDLERLANKKRTPGMQMQVGVGQNELPESIHRLGRFSEHQAAWVYDGTPPYEGAKATVLFGNRSRTWGVYVGTETDFPERPHFKRIRVAEDSFFFFGGND